MCVLDIYGVGESKKRVPIVLSSFITQPKCSLRTYGEVIFSSFACSVSLSLSLSACLTPSHFFTIALLEYIDIGMNKPNLYDLSIIILSRLAIETLAPMLDLREFAHNSILPFRQCHAFISASKRKANKWGDGEKNCPNIFFSLFLPHCRRFDVSGVFDKRPILRNM